MNYTIPRPHTHVSNMFNTIAYIDIYTNAYSEANIVVDSLAFCLIGPQAIPSTTKIK